MLISLMQRITTTSDKELQNQHLKYLFLFHCVSTCKLKILVTLNI